MDPSQNKITLSQMPIGSRILFRSRNEWRAASIARVADGRVSIQIASPLGRIYRISRSADTALYFDGRFYRLRPKVNSGDFVPVAVYDRRW
ncbi:MAG: hypothetical protein AB1477_07845 [Acidobacteriota bacterium]|jgi:hypothetical protein